MGHRMIYGTKKDPLRSPNICRKSDIERFKKTLRVGTTYELTKVTTSAEPGSRKKIRNVRYMRLVAKNPHNATLEDENGNYTSYGYWELQKLIKGEEYS